MSEILENLVLKVSKVFEFRIIYENLESFQTGVKNVDFENLESF